MALRLGGAGGLLRWSFKCRRGVAEGGGVMVPSCPTTGNVVAAMAVAAARSPL